MTAGTLTDDEMARVRAEVLDNLLDVGALPYVSVMTIYAVIRDNVLSSTTAATSSSSSVTAAGPTTITVASAAGLVAGTKVQIDCDGLRETVTLRDVSGTTLSVVCSKIHSGTYPVEIESPRTLVRGLLFDLANLEQTVLQKATSTAGVKKVDEIELFGPGDGRSRIDELERRRTSLRWALASACSLTAILRQAMSRAGCGSGVEMY